MKNKKGIKQVNKFFAFWLRLLRIKSLSVYQLTLSMLVITAVFSVGFIFAGWTYTETLRIKTKIKELKNTSLNKQKEKLKVEVSRLISYLEYVQQDTNHHSLEQIKEEALLYFESLRFGNDGYVFVNTYDGIALLFDGQKLDKYRNITDLTDTDGFKIFEKELELAKLPEGGYFQYFFKKIYDDTPHSKLSYVMGFDEWEWIIGTGDYLDNIEDEINFLEQDLKRDMYRNILIAFWIFVSLLIVLILAAYWFAIWIQDQFNKFVISLKQASLSKNKEQSLDRIFIRELKTISFEIIQAEELAKEFGNIIDQSKNEIYIFSQDSFKFVHANLGAIQNCGYSLSELKELTPIDIAPEIEYNRLKEIIEPLKQNQVDRVHLETQNQRKDKTRYFADVFLTTSILYEEPVYIAFIYDISERKKTENQLSLSKERYTDLFENAPISLWEEDFTALVEYLDAQLKQHNLPIEELFEKHPDVLYQCAALVKVVNVNKQTLDLFEAQNKEELYGNLNKLFSEDSILPLKQSLFALYRGEKQFSSEGENLTLKGKKLDVLLRWSFLSNDGSLARKIIVSILDLTELRKKEESLKEAQRIAKIGNWELDLITNKLNWSDEVYRLFDLKPQQYGATYDAFLDSVHPDDREFVNNAYEESLKTKEPYNIVHRLLLKEGTIKFVQEYCETFYDKDGKAIRSVGTIQDVTEKRKAEKALNQSNKLMQYIVEHNQSDVAVHDRELKYLYVSQSYLEHYKVKDQNVIGKHHYDVFPDLPQKWRDIHQKALAGEVSSADSDSYVRENGTVEWTRWECRPWYEADGSIGGIIVYTEVITEQKQIEEELKKHRNQLKELVEERTAALEESQDALLNLVDDLNHKSGELETSNIRFAEINEELETFTYSVSHDLKAPLRGIDGYGQLLQDSCGKELDTEAQEFLANIRKSTQQMNVLIEDLLAYSRMERKDFESESVLFKPIIDNLLLAYSKIIDKNQVQIKLSFPADFELIGDKDGLNLVFRNLIDNALKFTLGDQKVQIEIGASESDTHWHIFVKDNGIGFDMNYHDRIFKIFQRLHLPEEYEGTGIGLAMVSKAVQRMNGKIWAESELGKGSCFYVEIGKA